MWKDLDPNKITSTVCMQCAACCKHTVRYIENLERYATQKVEYLMAMHDKPKEDFVIETTSANISKSYPENWKVIKNLVD